MYQTRDLLVKEHQVIERDLIELDTIIKTSPINYPNLIHTLKKLNSFWDQHENKEDPYFKELQNKGFPIPVKKILFEHGQLKKHRESLIHGLHTGSEKEMRTALERDGRALIDKMRKHMQQEDWIFYALPKTDL